MSNDLVKLEDLDDLPIQEQSDEAWDASANSNVFLPRLQLLTANSKKCKSGDFPINHYALIQDSKHDDLGKNLDVLVIAWHPKALETGEVIIEARDPESEEFQRIQEKSETKNSGCMFGPEFLTWIPSVKRFATFFMGTKSSRREAGNLRALLKKSASLSNQECKNKYYTWYAPAVSACSTPFEMPTKNDLLAAIEQFNVAPKNDVEGVAEEEETRAR